MATSCNSFTVSSSRAFATALGAVFLTRSCVFCSESDGGAHACDLEFHSQACCTSSSSLSLRRTSWLSQCSATTSKGSWSYNMKSLYLFLPAHPRPRTSTLSNLFIFSVFHCAYFIRNFSLSSRRSQRDLLKPETFLYLSQMKRVLSSIFVPPDGMRYPMIMSFSPC